MDIAASSMDAAADTPPRAQPRPTDCCSSDRSACRVCSRMRRCGPVPVQLCVVSWCRPAGHRQGPSHLSIVYEPNHHGDDAFRSAILHGARQHHWNFGDMAAITGVDNDEIDDIIAYVRSEQERHGFDQ